jgi:hypothetical protein
MRVPLLDLTQQYKQIQPEIHRAIDDIVSRQQFILGPEVAALEKKSGWLLRCAVRCRRLVRNGRVALRFDGTRHLPG